MKRSVPFPAWVRRTLGAALVLGVVIVMVHSKDPIVSKASAALLDEGPMPDLGGAVGWLNSAPLNRKSLRGKVALVNFWTYTCINSLRPQPYVRAWATKYKDSGFVVIGAHPGVLVRERTRKRGNRRAQFEDYLPSRHRHQLRDLGCV
jgi:thiol-disulfide isomerase/thioredoxin